MAARRMVRNHDPGAEKAVADLLRAIGEDPKREGLERTPERVAKAMALLTSGSLETPRDAINGAIFADSFEGMIVVQGIEFHSLCEHHLLPFHGRAHIAYLPAGRVLGRSRLPRLLDVYARRLQLQERLTGQLARAVQQAILPRGVAVRLEAAHLCQMMRGVERQQSLTMTSSFLGAFDRDMRLRHQFLSSLRPATLATPRETRVETVGSVEETGQREGLVPRPAIGARWQLPPTSGSRFGVGGL